MLKPVPGTDGRLLLSAVAAGYKGVIVEGFGQGGLPNIHKQYLDAIEAAVKMNVAVVVTTQWPSWRKQPVHIRSRQGP